MLHSKANPIQNFRGAPLFLKRMLGFIVGTALISVPFTYATKNESWSAEHSAQLWDKLQQNYRTVSKGKKEFIFPRIQAEIVKLASLALSPLSLLDDGCGSGYDIRRLLIENAELLSTMHGIDTSEQGIAIANSFAQSSTTLPILFSVKNRALLEELESSQKYDVILSTNVVPVLPTYEDLVGLFSQHARLLNTNGRILITFISQELLKKPQVSHYYQVLSQGAAATQGPIPYRLRLAQMNDQSLEFDDHAWPTEVVAQALNDAGLKVYGHEYLNDSSGPEVVHPFEFMVAGK